MNIEVVKCLLKKKRSAWSQIDHKYDSDASINAKSLKDIQNEQNELHDHFNEQVDFRMIFGALGSYRNC